jgi:hypothetical protein
MGHIKITITTPHRIHRAAQNNIKTRTTQEAAAQEKIKSYVLKQMYSILISERRKWKNTGMFELKNLCTVAISTSEQLPEGGQVWPKHAAV